MAAWGRVRGEADVGSVNAGQARRLPRLRRGCPSRNEQGRLSNKLRFGGRSVEGHLHLGACQAGPKDRRADLHGPSCGERPGIDGIETEAVDEVGDQASRRRVIAGDRERLSAGVGAGLGGQRNFLDAGQDTADGPLCGFRAPKASFRRRRS